jgi:AcrR family transcriptional regulator
MADVKRGYDATSRRAQARRRRDAVVATAEELFLAQGFAGTTVAAVARRSGVSVELVYKHFGDKAGLLRAVVERALEGSGPVPAESRADALPAADAAALVRGWGRLAAEVAPVVSPVLLLVRAAAAQDPDAERLADELDAARMRRMSGNARRLAEAGHLGEGVTVESAADVMWTLSSPEVYDLLVRRRGWDPAGYRDFVTRGIAALLAPPP